MSKRQHKLKGERKYILFFFDFIIWNLSYYVSFAMLRFSPDTNSFTLEGYKTVFFQNAVILNLCFIVVFLLFRQYDRIWRYADIEDFFYACVASGVANIAFYVISLSLGPSYHLGKRTHILLILTSTFLLFAFRFLYRLTKLLEMRHLAGKPKKRMLMVGAGEAAVTILREISKSPSNEYIPICIADDDRGKVGRRISGIKVQGTTEEIPELCRKNEIEAILFSISSIDLKNKKRILDICARTNVEVKIIPDVYGLLTASVPLSSQFRRVEVEDLLGREPVVFDTERYGAYLAGQTVLITGGGGSIGSELCRQIAKLAPKKLIVLDIYENNAYEIQQELKRTHEELDFEVEIASVRDADKLEQLFSEKKIDVVFHAAAHKHVPLMETNPEEAVKNNVFGTLNVVRAADKYRVKRFVLISTDKAVNPTNVMGATKRICEMIVQSMNQHSRTEFVAVRFGNVLGSNGSVIPLFKEQISAGGPVTVTHPDIIRYFMTIPEAVSLVLTAGGLAHGGEIFVLDMGEPVKIKDLAENLIRLSGYRPDVDIPIKYLGLRPGEKLYEELLMNEEGMKRTESKKIYIGHPIELCRDRFLAQLEVLRQYALNNEKQKVIEMLQAIVPTFSHKR